MSAVMNINITQDQILREEFKKSGKINTDKIKIIQGSNLSMELKTTPINSNEAQNILNNYFVKINFSELPEKQFPIQKSGLYL